MQYKEQQFMLRKSVTLYNTARDCNEIEFLCVFYLKLQEKIPLKFAGLCDLRDDGAKSN